MVIEKAFGLVTVMVATEVSLSTTVEGLKALVMVAATGAAVTVSVPDAAVPAGASDDVTCDVVFTCAPIAIPRTLTVMVHDCPAVRTLDVLENVSVPGLIVNMPPPVAGVLQVPPVCVMRSIPAGIVSLNWTLVIEKAFGLVTVMVATELPLSTTVDGLKALVMVAATGAAVTVSVPDAAVPGGALLAVTCDVVFTCEPITVPRTLTVIVHDCPPARTLDVLENVSVPGLIVNIPPPVAMVRRCRPSA